MSTSEPQRIAVFGAGYVGLVTGACFADLGHHVVVRDVIPERIAALRRKEIPIHEPGLDELVARNAERLSFTTDVAEAVRDADFVYVAVGTPPTYSGDADLTAVWTVIDELPAVDRHVVVVMKSTVPVGTGEKVRHRLGERGLDDVGYASNPEFTAEGTAVHDFMHPDRIVVGAFEEVDGDAVVALHAGIDAPVVRADVASAEMIKLAANAALMTRISFINEIANVCEATGADVVKVSEGIGLDRRIGKSFLRAGIGFGGSCLLGDETVMVQDGGVPTLAELFASFDSVSDGIVERVDPEELSVLTWVPGRAEADYSNVGSLSRRRYVGSVLTVELSAGRLVTATADHPFLVREPDSGAIVTVLARDLAVGDHLPVTARAVADDPLAPPQGSLPGAALATRTTVGFAPISRITERSFEGDVYSLEVPGPETFVTTGGIIVHNCFPKDSLALKQLAANSGYHFQLLNAVIEVNELQKRRVIGKLRERLGSLRDKHVALLGLAFKPNTDDTREAPALVLAGRLLAEGADVRVWDPIARVDGLHGVEHAETVAEAVAGADAVVLVTEWPELAHADWPALRRTMRGDVLVDGRNFLDPGAMREAGFDYEAIGRAATEPGS